MRNKLIAAVISLYTGVLFADASTLPSVTSPIKHAPETFIHHLTIPKKGNLSDGMVLKVQGTVGIVGENKRIRGVHEKSLFFTHDIIFTKQSSYVALRFNDGSFIALGPDSILEIKSFRLTNPGKDMPYQGALNDGASVKLYTGILKARLGSLVLENKIGAFAILTPRGRIELSEPQKNPNIDLSYNNKSGLVVKATGVLKNSQGQVSIGNKIYGIVSAIIGSSPTTMLAIPLALSDAAVVRTGVFFKTAFFEVNNTYNESIISVEEHTLSMDTLKVPGLSANSNGMEPIDFGADPGDDDGSSNTISPNRESDDEVDAE